ncbi:hypothetical protein TCAL_15612, partial [Tigriopus californicus]
MANLCCTYIVYALWISIMTEASTNPTTNSSSPNRRGSKVLSIFQIVQFKNGPCSTTGAQSGTCYTQGTAAGTCAGGFGVCCIINLACGGMSSENCTYLAQTSSTTGTSTCQYTICPCDENICRIRFDFVASGSLTTLPGAIGDCTMDTFGITAPGNFAPPIICGFNTGQHMIVDADPDNCNEATFDFSGGPDGCLQYFTGNNGTVASHSFVESDSNNVLEARNEHLCNLLDSSHLRKRFANTSQREMLRPEEKWMENVDETTYWY